MQGTVQPFLPPTNPHTRAKNIYIRYVLYERTQFQIFPTYVCSTLMGPYQVPSPSELAALLIHFRSMATKTLQQQQLPSVGAREEKKGFQGSGRFARTRTPLEPVKTVSPKRKTGDA